MLNYHSVLQSIFTMYSEFTHSQSSISQTLMSNFSQMGPQRFIRCYFQMLRQTTHNYYDYSYYYGSKGMTHWKPRERACDSTVEVRIALLEDVARSWLQPLFLATAFTDLTSALSISSATAQPHCSALILDISFSLTAVLLNPPNTVPLWYSPSACGDPNHQIIFIPTS